MFTPALLDDLFKQAKRYSAKDRRRFADHKRDTLMLCFLLETRKSLRDHLVTMPDQDLVEIARPTKNADEQTHRELRKRQKWALDGMLDTADFLLEWPDDQPLSKHEIWRQVEAVSLRSSRHDRQEFQRLEERGYGELLLNRSPSLRKDFADFRHLPFAAKQGHEHLLHAITLVRKLDAGELNRWPPTAPSGFVPKERRRALNDQDGQFNRNAWEMGRALAIQDAWRAGDRYRPQSKHHVSFWDLTLSDARWQEVRLSSSDDLQPPQQHEVKAVLAQQFHEASALAKHRFAFDNFAAIQDGQLKLKRDDNVALPPTVLTLQQAINSRLPLIRIEPLFMEVDHLTGFRRHFTPVHGYQARPPQCYQTLLAALISQATNLGVVSMSASVQGISIDMLRHVRHDFVREDTLTAASAEIVNRHHALP